MIVGMNHFTVIAEDEAATLAFYVDLLGLSVGPRPDLGFPGAWLYAGGPNAVLHMYFGRPMPTTRAGVIDHMAFSATDLRAVKGRSMREGSSTTRASRSAQGHGSCSVSTRTGRRWSWI